MRHHSHKRRPLFALCAAIAFSPPFLADDAKPASRPGACANRPDAGVMALPVRAIRGGSQTLDTLQPWNFVLTDGKAPIHICGVAHDRQPASLGIVLDISTSMRGRRSDLQAIARLAIGKLLDASQPGDEYFLEYVSDVPVMPCAFGCGPRQILDGIHVQPKGKTALIDGLYMALHEMSKARNPNRALLVLSDGLDTSSTRKFHEVENAYADSPVPLFLLVPTEAGDPFLGPWPVVGAPAEARRDLERLVARSGGMAVGAIGSTATLAEMAEFASLIRSPYILYFAAPPRHPTRLRAQIKGVRWKPHLLYGAAYETRMEGGL
jgi:hypothetical protein